MAHQEEPMDVDSSVCEFDNKENAYQHGNVPKTPCMEKGYEELDVSELNMKLRYSTTPAGSPMSKSFTANVDNRTVSCKENDSENASNNMTRSLQSTFTANESRLPKTLPLQAFGNDPCHESTRNVLGPLDSTVTLDSVKVSISTPNETDDVSYPSSSSSLIHTPEATTPTKDMTKDAGSPIMGVFKSVLNMFRPSQSPIPPEDENALKSEVLSPPIISSPNIGENPQAALVSTPLAARTTVDMLTRHTIPPKENIVFKEELQNELQWSDDSTIIFADEKVPLHKLLFPNLKSEVTPKPKVVTEPENVMDNTVEYMDISYNDSVIDKTLNTTQDKLDKTETIVESDSEFVDCETTFNKNDTIFSAETSLEYVDFNLDSTKDIVEKLTILSDDNISSNTLEASTKSADLSNVSVETAKADTDMTFEVSKQDSGSINNGTEDKLSKEEDTEYQKEKLLVTIDNLSEDKTLEDAKLLGDVAAQVSFSLSDCNSDSPIISRPDKHIVKTSVTYKSIVDTVPKFEASNDIVSHNIDDGNIVMNSIAQIPLIADPRILLFNVSSEVPVDKVQVDNLNTESSPADVPLPDDDELASLPPLTNNVVDNNVTQVNDIKYNEKDLQFPIEESPIVATNQGFESVVKSVLDNNDPVLQPVIEINATDKESETNALADALQTVTQAGIAPIIQNLITQDKVTIKQPQADEVAILHGIEQTLPNETVPTPGNNEYKLDDQHNTSTSNQIEVAIIQDVVIDQNVDTVEVGKQPDLSLSDNQTEVPIIQDIASNHSPDNVEVVTTNVTSKLVQIVANDNASILETESKPLTIDIPQSPKPENYVAPVSDLVIEGSVQAMPSPQLPNHNVKEHIIRTLPASIITKLNNSLGNRKSIEQKVDAAVIDSPVPVSEIAMQKSDDTPVKNPVETKEVQHYNETSSSPQNEVVDNVAIQNCTSFEKALQDISDDTDKSGITKADFGSSKIDESCITILILEKILETAKSQSSIKSSTHSGDEKEVNDEEIVASQSNSPFVSLTAEIEKQGTPILEENLNVKENATENTENFTKLDTTLPIETEHQPKQIQVENTEVKRIENTDETENALISKSRILTTDIETETQPKEIPVENTEVNTIDNTDETENAKIPKSRILTTPPTSPAIVSKGYNFNFDEIDDPFATKTKIRQSPTSDVTANQSFSHLDDTLPLTESPKIVVPQKRKPIKVNKRLGPATIIKSRKVTGICDTKKDEHLDKNLLSSVKNDLQNISKKGIVVTNELITNMPETKDSDFNSNETKTEMREPPPPDVDATPIQTASSKDNNETMAKGIPEITDLDLNPFATKNKIRESPPLSLNRTANNVIMVPTQEALIKDNAENEAPDFNPFETKTKMRESPPPSFDGTANNVASSLTREAPQKSKPENDPELNPFATYTKIQESPSPSLNITASNVNSSPKHEASMKSILENYDPEFNPFATKTKMRVSPPPSLDKTENISSSLTQAALCKEGLTLNIDTEKELSPIPGDTQEDEKCSLNDTNPDINVTSLLRTSTMEGVCSINTKENKREEDTLERAFLDEPNLKDDKMLDFHDDNVGMFELGDLPPGNEDNAEGEMFIDAQAFEFLLNQNKTNIVADSGKESLFLKFDPLFAKRLSGIGLSAALKRQGTPKKTTMTPKQSSTSVATPIRDATLITTVQHDVTFDKSSPRNVSFVEAPQKEATPVSTIDNATHQNETFEFDSQPDSTIVATSHIAGPSELNLSSDIEGNSTLEDSNADLNVTVTKPMMAVSPAVNPTATPRIRGTTPNRRSLTVTSPAIAVIDRLLSISANNSLVGNEASFRPSQGNNEAEQALTELRELLAEKEIDVHNLRTESMDLRERLCNMESQMNNLEAIGKERLKKINELNDKLNEKTKMNRSMAKVVEEYERTIASLITETEQDKKRHAEERVQLINEREEATSHLASMEVSFSDLHSKYEKSKQVIFGFKANEDALKKSVKDFEENLAKMQKNYETLKQHATAKLNYANEELDKLNKAHEAEVLKLNAMIKRKDVDITSLEETLAQKTKTNEELAAICDSLLAKFS